MPCERNRRRSSDDRSEDRRDEPDQQADSERSDQFGVSESECIPMSGEASPDSAEARVVEGEGYENDDRRIKKGIH